MSARRKELTGGGEYVWVDGNHGGKTAQKFLHRIAEYGRDIAAVAESDRAILDKANGIVMLAERLAGMLDGAK